MDQWVHLREFSTRVSTLPTYGEILPVLPSHLISASAVYTLPYLPNLADLEYLHVDREGFSTGVVLCCFYSKRAR